MLAAGLGTRLRPLTSVTPKPLMPVWGSSMLARVVALLREWGVDDIVVNCHYLHEQVEAWCASNGCRASYEPEILGTGGVLNPLREWIGEEPFFLVNGDIVMENAPCPKFKGDELAVALVSESGPRTIEVERESSFVTNWKSEDAGLPGTFTYCGVALLRAEILKYVEKTGFSSIVQAYERAMNEGRFVRAICPEEMMWTDAGEINTYIELNASGEDNAFADIPQLKAAAAAVAVAPDYDFLGARGSERVFFKLRRPGTNPILVVIYDDEHRGENAKYASHARWLRGKGVPVPQVLAELASLKTTAMEWGGASRSPTLEDDIKVMEALAGFGALGKAAAAELQLEESFGPRLWEWERGLFVEHCLGGRYHRELAPQVLAELKQVEERLEREPKALVHRDFQSTNVLWRGKELTLIDFQGMRLGPAIYDLASYLFDPYVERRGEDRIRALVKVYADRSGRDDLAEGLPFAAVQRLVQCLGAYGRLASVGQTSFAKYFLPALENLLAAADAIGLDAVGALAEDLIARERDFAQATGECGCAHHHHSPCV